MSAQPVTPELREWIVAQATAGQPPDVVLKSMLASGWNEDVAVAALEDTLRGYLDDHARAAGCRRPAWCPSRWWVKRARRCNCPTARCAF